MSSNAEEVIRLHDEPCGLRGFVVIHDTTRGPATGGIRLMRYRDENEALADGYRLARGLTYAPDFLINAGALIEGVRFLTASERSTDAVLEAIGERTRALLERARVAGLPPEQILKQAVDREFGRTL